MTRGWIAKVMLALALGVQPGTAQRQVEGMRVAMTHHAQGTFEVKMKPEPLSEVAGGTAIQRMSMDKVYHGPLEGAGKGEFLASGSPDGSGAYVAIERVTGTLDGRSGSFVLMHRATMTNRVPEIDVTVVPGSGTGELVGLKGSLKIIIEQGKHTYDFKYEL